MKSFALWLCGLACMLLVGSAALAEEGAAKADKAPNAAKADKAPKAEGAKADKAPATKSALKGEYQIMAAELKLDDAKKEELAKAAAAKQEVVAAWSAKGEKGAKLAEAEKALKEAKAAKDEAKTKEAEKTVADLKVEKDKAIAAADAAVLAVLTDAQKAEWQQYKLYTSVLAQFKKVKFTDEQKAKIRELAKSATADYVKADPAKQKEMMTKLKADAEALLTPEQKAAMTAAPKTKPATDAAAKPAGEGEAKAPKAPKGEGAKAKQADDAK